MYDTLVGVECTSVPVGRSEYVVVLCLSSVGGINGCSTLLALESGSDEQRVFFWHKSNV